jgi:alkylhydroperoxidase family enzyme
MMLAQTIVDPILVELARLRIASLLGNEAALSVRSEAATSAGLSEAKIQAIAQWPTSPLYDEGERATLALTEQFVIDVGGITDEQTQSVLDAIGPAGLQGLVQALYVHDMSQRLEMSLSRALHPANPSEERR